MTYKEYQETLEKIALQNVDELGVGELLFGLSEVAMTLCGPVLIDIKEQGKFDELLQEIKGIHQQILDYDSSVVGSALLATMLFNLFAMGLASLDNPDHLKIEGVEFKTRGKEE